jgi:hypothetical protein
MAEWLYSKSPPELTARRTKPQFLELYIWLLSAPVARGDDVLDLLERGPGPTGSNLYIMNCEGCGSMYDAPLSFVDYTAAAAASGLA